MILNQIVKGAAPVAVQLHAYKVMPKSRFVAGEVTVDGKKMEAKITCRGHAKFPPYTYLTLDGQLYYIKGDLDKATLAKPPVEKK